MILASQQLGEGARPTLLLHGFLGSGRNLRTVALEWAKRDASRRFVLVDLTGHGESQPMPPNTTLATMGRDVLDTADALGLAAPLEVVGHSLGGRVALAASALAPERMGKVTLLDIAPGPIPRERSESGKVLEVLLRAPATAPDRATMRYALISAGLTMALADWLLMNLVPQPDGVLGWRFDRAALDRLQPSVNEADLWTAAERLRERLTCIRGSRSSYVTDHDLARLAASGADFFTLPAGHYLHVDALPQLVDLLAR